LFRKSRSRQVSCIDPSFNAVGERFDGHARISPIESKITSEVIAGAERHTHQRDVAVDAARSGERKGPVAAAIPDTARSSGSAG